MKHPQSKRRHTRRASSRRVAPHKQRRRAVSRQRRRKSPAKVQQRTYIRRELSTHAPRPQTPLELCAGTLAVLVCLALSASVAPLERSMGSYHSPVYIGLEGSPGFVSVGTSSSWSKAYGSSTQAQSGSQGIIVYDTSLAEGPQSHVFSHRGASGEAIEHTFEAFDLALAQGSVGIELDIVLSKDGTIFVSHDESALRITGVNKNYGDMKDVEIAKLRAGNGEKIHTLEEVIERYADRATLMVEFKGKAKSKAGRAKIKEFCRLINGRSLEKLAMQSFDMEYLEAIEAHYPSLQKALLISNEDTLTAALASPVPDMLSLSSKIMTRKRVEEIHAAGKKASVYTIDDEADILRFIEMGVDSYYTNYSSRALELERQSR